ncbi:unnamed protein product [Brassica napus]|uniref:(rape) hypothetical protein n=1 Tax=Brassica napus TaxID=3708 RepID=A0A816YFQ9_BRANA|nr:unnamed protein product [Brassica napus]
MRRREWCVTTKSREGVWFQRHFFFLVKYKDIVIMLMKLFFENGKVNMELNLRKYMMEKGYCPHGHALELFTNA